jgi:predicted flap endonuclease-1-like 5' DNA nuclease
MASVSKMKGMTPDLFGKMKANGLANSDKFLAAVKTTKDRAELAKAMGVAHTAVLELANRADLARIKGIGEVFSNLLENAGVDTVKELATRVPENLHAKLAQINMDKKMAGRTPTLAQVTNWVEQAKALPRMLEY